MGIQQMLLGVGASEQVILSQDILAGYSEPISETFMTGFVAGAGGSIVDGSITYNGSVIGELVIAAHDGTNTWIAIAYSGSPPPEEYLKDVRIDDFSIMENFLEYFWELHGDGVATYIFSGTSGIAELETFHLHLVAE